VRHRHAFLRILQARVDARRITAAAQIAPTIGDEPNPGATADIVNTGYELSAWFNLSRNVTGLVNLSHAKTDRSNVFPEFEGWYEREHA
jgi:predicted ATP-grasp superfamily ATP-dependent carboligase